MLLEFQDCGGLGFFSSNKRQMNVATARAVSTIIGYLFSPSVPLRK